MNIFWWFVKGEKMKVLNNTITFSSGKIRDANCGIIGITGNLEIFGGYDEVVYQKGSTHWGKEELTEKDLNELASYMITLWTKVIS